MGSDILKELPAFIVSSPSVVESGTPAVDVRLHLNTREFQFREKDGRRTQALTFIAALFDGSGNFVSGKEAEIRFAFKEPTYSQMAESELDMSLTLEAPSGNYHLRAVG